MSHDVESTTDRVSPLEMDSATFRRLGHALIDQLADAIAAVPSGPVTRGEAPSAVRAALGVGGPLPEQGTDVARLLESTTNELFAHSLFNAHPRFFGYITAPPTPVGVFGDLIAAAANPNVGAWILAPLATEIEVECVRWIAELIGMPSGTGGILVSGGNMANMLGFYAARAATAGWDVSKEGVAAPGAPRLRVYGSTETHTWIEKACDMAGLGTGALRWIPTDRDLRMDFDALRSQIAKDRAAGDRPMMVVGTSGSVGTGAIDPLPQIAELCREQGIWFHADGAYGGFAAAAPDAPADLRALALADSVAVDPHKWLYAPLEVGCALVRDPEKLRAAFAYHPPYFRFDEQVTNYNEFGPQNSRGFRALKVWLALKQAGASGYRTMIGDDMRLSRVMHEAVSRHPELEPFTQGLSISTFRYVPADLRPRVGDETVEQHLNALNRELLDRIQNGGETFVSNAVIRGHYVLRACVVNFHTRHADVLAVPEIAARIGREIDRATRPKGL